MVWRLALVMAVVLGLLQSGGGLVAAQDAAGLPANLHEGMCADVGAVVFELTGVGAVTTNPGSPVPAQEPVGAPGTVPVLQSVTTIDASLTDLTEVPHALVVSEAGGRTSRALACGEVGGLLTMQMAGMVMPGDELAIALRELDGSGDAGIALLTADGLTTTVRIYLAEGLAADARSTCSGADDQPTGRESSGVAAWRLAQNGFWINSSTLRSVTFPRR